MVRDVVRPNATLSELLSARAHNATPRRLLLDILGGAAVAAGAAVMEPPGWVLLLCASACFCAYGVWAFAEQRLEWRTLYTSRAVERAWRLARAGAAVVGVGAWVLMMLSALMLMLGTWIS